MHTEASETHADMFAPGPVQSHRSAGNIPLIGLGAEAADLYPHDDRYGRNPVAGRLVVLFLAVFAGRRQHDAEAEPVVGFPVIMKKGRPVATLGRRHDKNREEHGYQDDFQGGGNGCVLEANISPIRCFSLGWRRRIRTHG